MRKKSINIKLLIEGCLKDNRNSQRKLYEHFYGYAMNIAQCYSKNREEAAEILNDAFLKAFRNMEKYDPAYSFKAWFRKILVNTAIDYYRASRNSPHHLAMSELPELGEDNTPMPRLSMEEDALPILQKLTPAYRMVFNLFVLEEYKHHEIAEMLNISVSASRSNLARAKQRLKTLLINKGGQSLKTK